MEMILIFVLVLGVAFVGAQAFMGGDDDEEEVKKRMTIFTGGPEEGPPTEQVLAPKKDQKASASNALIQKIGQAITPKGIAMMFERQLERADLPLRANEFAGMVFLACMVPGGMAWLITRSFVWTVVALLFGALAPFLYLQLLYSRKLRRFNDQMLDTLTLLANAVKAGYSMVQAMEMVAKESPPPMGSEFTRVIREVSLGVTIEDALMNLKERVPSGELDLMVTVINIQRQIGGNLSEILESIAETIRERNKLMGMIAALTAQGRLSGLIIGGLPFALTGVLYAINPPYISLLWTYSKGAFHSYYLIILCLVMEMVGFFIISKITTIEV